MSQRGAALPREGLSGLHVVVRCNYALGRLREFDAPRGLETERHVINGRYTVYVDDLNADEALTIAAIVGHIQGARSIPGIH